MHNQYHPPGLDPAASGSRYLGLFPALIRAAIIAAIVTLLAVSLGLGQPAAQQLVAQMLCAGGDRIETALPWSGVWCVGEDGQRSNNILPWLYLGTFVVIFDVCVVAVIFLARRRARENMSLPGMAAVGLPVGSPPSSGTPRVFQSIFVNGRAYNSPDEMPPEVRQAFAQMQGMFADSNQNGMPDLFEGKGMEHLTQRIGEWGAATTGDPAERLQKLQELRASGLISEEEYQAKRAEILASM